MLLGLALTLLTILWAGAAYFALRPHGVTGSDPYAYVQMAVDLTQHGTLLHTFSLAPQLAQWGLPTWPAAPIGYQPPPPQTGVAATVWPPGYGVLLSLAYRLAGEGGLYALPPLLGLGALAALWLLSLEVLRAWPAGSRHLAAGVAVLVLATSYRQVEGAVMPMADVASQVFTVLAVWGALRGARATARRQWVPYTVLAGLCLGAAFAIRYTQVLTAVCLLFCFVCLRPEVEAKWGAPWHAGWRGVAGRLLVCGLAAWLVALPVLGYHTLAFGGPFKVGSAELTLFGGPYVLPSALSLAQELLRTNECLYVTPFLLWGFVRLWGRARRPAVALLLWLGLLVAFHLPYAAVRARDLLAEFPVLAVWVGAGAADLLEKGKWRPALAGLALLLLLGARGRITLQLPLHPERFNTFGYLNAEQRAAFDTLKAQTPPGAIIAASLNSGAIDLYTGREAVRPAYWTPEAWLSFVQHAAELGRPVYLLADGEELEAPRQALVPRYTLQTVAELALPYFYPDGHAEARHVPLYVIGH